jgi:hypothetical protein
MNNRSLYIITGFVKFEWIKRDDEAWSEDSVEIPMLAVPNVPVIGPRQWVDCTAVASPAGFYFSETGGRDKVGFGVNYINVRRPQIASPDADFYGTDYAMFVGLSILGNDARFYRLSFELSIEARDE